MSADAPSPAPLPTLEPPPRRRLGGRRLLLALLGIFLIAVIPAIVGPTLLCRPADPALPVYGTLPPFAFVDDTGAPFTEEALRGHPTIVDFVFTRCDMICPVLSLKMQRLQDKTGDRRGVDIKLLSISVDPTYDTPARLDAYARRFRADPRRWRFLTGPEDAVRALSEGPFMSAMQHVGLSPSGAPDISHSGKFFLVDGDLQIRGMYDSNNVQELDELIRHARFLNRTQRGYKFGGS